MVLGFSIRVSWSFENKTVVESSGTRNDEKGPYAAVSIIQASNTAFIRVSIPTHRIGLDPGALATVQSE